MTRFAPFFARVEATSLATTISRSVLLTGLLSGIHLLALTLLVGGILVSTLRLCGVVLPNRPAADLLGAARRGIVIGLIVSVASGLLLLAPRVSTASANGTFQVKMLLLCAAAAFHFAIYRDAARGVNRTRLPPGVTGALGLALWFGVVLAGCAFILLE